VNHEPTLSYSGNKLYLEELSLGDESLHSLSESDLSSLQQQQEQLISLQSQVEELRQENEKLQRQIDMQQQFIQSHPEDRPMIILESFEGDGSWFTRNNIFKDKVLVQTGDKTEIEDVESPEIPADIPDLSQTGEIKMQSSEMSSLQGITPIETPSVFKVVNGAKETVEDLQWCDEVESDGGTCPIEPNLSFRDALRDRACWLVGLLVMQSCSGFILARNEALLQNHPVIIYFLTMLVGAGGNAGNQASVRVIRGLALGSLNEKTQGQFIRREVKMAFSLSSILAVAGFLRAIFFRTPFPETVAVTAALLMIVFTSICLGAVLPLGLKRLGIDPAHSSTSIQVIMDILGVVMTVIVSGFMLDSPVGKLLVSSLGIGAAT